MATQYKKKNLIQKKMKQQINIHEPNTGPGAG